MRYFFQDPGSILVFDAEEIENIASAMMAMGNGAFFQSAGGHIAFAREDDEAKQADAITALIATMIHTGKMRPPPPPDDDDQEDDVEDDDEDELVWHARGADHRPLCGEDAAELATTTDPEGVSCGRCAIRLGLPGALPPVEVHAYEPELAEPAGAAPNFRPDADKAAEEAEMDAFLAKVADETTRLSEVPPDEPTIVVEKPDTPP